MGLLQMSFYGAVMILAVMLIHTVGINRLPKRTFIILWGIVLLRLLIPFEITSDFSVYSLIEYGSTDTVGDENFLGLPGDMEISHTQAASLTNNTRVAQETIGYDSGDKIGVQSSKPFTEGNAQLSGTLHSDAEMLDNSRGTLLSGLMDDHAVTKITGILNFTESSVCRMIWGIVAVLCTAFFIIAYARCRIEFGMSLPISNDDVDQWLRERRMSGSESSGLSYGSRIGSYWARHSVSVRVSDRIDAPLTYGIIHPVILLPKKMEWDKKEQLEYILWHEYTHICSGDSLLKLAAVTALCLHWFNPLVWAMYFILNRDIELACDESVVYRCGVNGRSDYANMLIAMEAKRSGLVPLGNNFSQNAIERRVRAIMKMKKFSVGAAVFAVLLVVSVTTVFATSARNKNEYGETESSMGLPQEDRAIGNESENVPDQIDEDDTVNGKYTQHEWDMLHALQFEGYEDMTVSEFREKVNGLSDSKEYADLLERFSNDEAMYRVRDLDDTAFFIFYVLNPLIGDQWQRSFKVTLFLKNISKSFQKSS